MFSDFRTKLKRYIKENIISAFSREFMKNELVEIKFYRNVKSKRNKLADIVAFKFDSVTIKMIKAMKRKRDENDLKKTERTANFVEDKLLREREKIEKERIKR